MPDLLLELFSEEIPARMQARAAEDLRKLITNRLVDAGLVYEGAKAFATPRRLALTVQGLPARQPDVKEEKKGPRVGAPDGAIQGFLRAAGLKSIEEATVKPDKKGDFYVAEIEKPGRLAIEVISEIVPAVVRTFPWPKSMRWGAPSAKSGAFNWVRPLHSIVATFGPETEDPDIVPFSIDGIAAGDKTRGHRFMAPKPFKVRRLDDYKRNLFKAKVVLDPERRQEIILADAKTLAFAQGYELVEDAELLSEVAGLVEWPVALMGKFEKAFLAIPPEIIRATIRNNQKCFVLHGRRRLANRFILVANIEAEDGGKAIVAGNERVIRARLSDAKFFYESDLKTRLEDRLEKFKDIVFHEQLGSQWERIERIEQLAGELAPLVGADAAKTKRAARLAKADLLTEVVGEFPELQGLMGKYYALAQGEDAAVAAASEEHYKPLGPGDRVPTDPVSVAVALADKIDTLVGFWAIDEKPTGSKDPYALRRAALSITRLVLDNTSHLHISMIANQHLRKCLISEADKLHQTYDYFVDADETGEEIPLSELEELFRRRFSTAILAHEGTAQFVYANYLQAKKLGKGRLPNDELMKKFKERVYWLDDYFECSIPHRKEAEEKGLTNPEDVAATKSRWENAAAFVDTIIQRIVDDLLSFFADRLKVQLREQGARHDLVDAVFALEGQDDLLLIVRRVEALGKFLDTDDGKNLLAGYKRATNIIRIEEKKDGREYVERPDPSLYRQDEERALSRAIDTAKEEAAAAVAREDFEAAMHAMAKLRPHVDAFFDKVTVNVAEGADREKLRENRLKLLNEIRDATRTVADFSRIEG